jgi:hypothetical protein
MKEATSCRVKMRRTSEARTAYRANKVRQHYTLLAEIRGAAFNYKERNILLSSLGFGSYGEYLQSELWDSIRKVAMKDKCHCCSGHAQHLHHRIYTIETLTKPSSQLISLCEACHVKVEFRGGEKRFARPWSPRPAQPRKKKKKSDIPLASSVCRKTGGSGLSGFMKK